MRFLSTASSKKWKRMYFKLYIMEMRRIETELEDEEGGRERREKWKEWNEKGFSVWLVTWEGLLLNFLFWTRERHDHHSFIEKERKENKRDECYCHIEYYYITFRGRARANQMTECTHYTIHHSSLYVCVYASLSFPALFFLPPHWEFQFEIHQKGRETSFPRDWDPNIIEFVRQWLGIGEVVT